MSETGEPWSDLRKWAGAERRSGIEPIPGYAERQPCSHPEHKPPGMIVIPAGHRLRHVCPRCGNVQFVYSRRDGLDFVR